MEAMGLLKDSVTPIRTPRSLVREGLGIWTSYNYVVNIRRVGVP